MSYDPATGTYEATPQAAAFARVKHYRDQLHAQGVRITIPQAANRIAMSDALTAGGNGNGYLPFSFRQMSDSMRRVYLHIWTAVS